MGAATPGPDVLAGLTVSVDCEDCLWHCDYHPAHVVNPARAICLQKHTLSFIMSVCIAPNTRQMDAASTGATLLCCPLSDGHVRTIRCLCCICNAVRLRSRQGAGGAERRDHRAHAAHRGRLRGAGARGGRRARRRQAQAAHGAAGAVPLLRAHVHCPGRSVGQEQPERRAVRPRSQTP